MTLLHILNTIADLIEMIFELGAFTRKYLVPALVATYVAVVMTIEYFRGPSRSRMIQVLTKEWKRITMADPNGDIEESLEFVWYLESLSDNELVTEYRGL